MNHDVLIIIASSWAAFTSSTNGDAEDFPSSRQMCGQAQHLDSFGESVPKGVAFS
jgi:hypothetical protein